MNELNKNKMNEIKLEKVVLSIGGTADILEKGFKLLERITREKPIKRISVKRIPSLNVRPGLPVGCMVTLRRKKAEEILKRLLQAIGNQLKKKQITENSFSFGIKEYIEIPGMEYQRDIGIMGLDVSVSFTRPGKRVIRKKIKKGRLPKKQNISPEEIMDFMQKKFNIKIK
ncbi:MAG: 50S ribosomal protein L5 [Candidatus Pacearchaeota archaeon]